MATVTWKPSGSTVREIDKYITEYRRIVQREAEPLIAMYCPALRGLDTIEYRKLIELSTKMSVVGRACCEVAGYQFDERRRLLSILYGICCFFADSFIDDYGEAVAKDYLDRFERLLTHGWFEVRSDREKLFYVVLSRIFMLRDIMDPLLRQAIFSLYEAQRRDVMLRLNAVTFQALPKTRRLSMLKTCARDRSGHAITVLIRLVAPELPLQKQHAVYLAGALIMYIDDHGDCWADLGSGRVTYMNQVPDPAQTLRTLYNETLSLMRTRLPQGRGRDLMSGFLYRYFITRLEKHEREKAHGGLSWAVYE